jgi:type VI secretion system protein ImpG
MGYGARNDVEREFMPMYGIDSRTASGTDQSFFTVRRQPRLLSAKERTSGPRSSYVGSEVFIVLADGQKGPFGSDIKQLGVGTLCTNRDLPLQMSLGQGDTDFVLQSGAPVEVIRCVAGPTRPRSSHAHGDMGWRLLSHLSLDHLTLMNSDDGQGAAALREMLGLYAELSEPAVSKQVRGITSVATQSIVRPLPMKSLKNIFSRITTLTTPLMSRCSSLPAWL